MIFDEIVLENFGVYRDRQSMVLSPPSPQKPVVLLGGLNGVGKTTFLDALQLTLYGKLARCSSRANLSYDEFLRRSVHWAADPAKGASLEVEFRHTSEGEEHRYRVNRTWTANNSGVRERIEVEQDGKYNRSLTETWSEYIESLIPLRISHLFFFDGEKIEGLADLKNSHELLSTAIRSLLGIDIVDKLITDLVVLERRKRVAGKSDIERWHINEAEEGLRSVEESYDELYLKRAGLQNELDQSEKHLREVENNFRVQGGELFERQKDLESARASAEAKLHDAETQLREMAAGAAPFLLVEELLESVIHQVIREEETAQTEVFGELLEERDAQILKNIRSIKAPKKTLTAIEEILQADRSQRSASTGVPRYLNVPVDSRALLHSLQSAILPEARTRLLKQLQETEQLQNTLVDQERNLAAVPDPDALTHLIEERNEARHAYAEIQARLNALDVELERVKRERDAKRARLEEQIKKKAELDLEHDDSTRIITHAGKTRATLASFRSSVTRHHIARIERFILESLKQLLRKKALVSDVKIDPERFSIDLYGKNGKPLSPERLSAGERQLLAISILWGLARASGQPLPAVIDTPMGRLDATHRTHLIKRYFPYASHQVLLLSTDEEINEGYYAQLKPWVGRSYSLEFDDSLGGTRVQPGYFGKGN
jgi:DNA sulfur modification protein DndD